MELSRIRSLSDEEVAHYYDKVAVNTGESLNFWRNEVVRRDQERYAHSMQRATERIKWMTLVMAIATVLNLILFGRQAFVL
jgi:hypothetical protein